jgi:hypothetical protein
MARVITVQNVHVWREQRGWLKPSRLRPSQARRRYAGAALAIRLRKTLELCTSSSAKGGSGVRVRELFS